MRFAEEIVAASFVPTWRSLLVRALDTRGLNQTEIANLLGITQSAVSKHLLAKLGPDPRLEHEPRLLAEVERVAEGLATGALSPFESLAIANALVREFEDRGPICRIHEAEMPSLQGLGCDLCIRPAGSDLLPRQQALTDLRDALATLERAPGVVALLPHVGSNIARALPGATRTEDVAAVPGALFEMRGTVKVPAPPEFGVSRHVAKVLLAILRHDPTRLACVNLAPTPRLLARAKAAGLTVALIEPTIETDPATLTISAPVPDLLHHGGAFGIEPQAYLTATDARTLANRVAQLAAP